ncbi:MAG: hypothetical protein K0R65_1726 [Crocinitomicaceae bacterium]|nr:hypothetical protein [Crocinitomicaceae bacterium]
MFSVGGFFIRGASARNWLIEIQSLGMSLHDIRIFPLPGSTANSIWGCIVLVDESEGNFNAGRHEYCQRVFPDFYIPEKCEVSPRISQEDHERLFNNKIHVFHPETGFVILEETLMIGNLFVMPEEKFRFVFSPEDTNFIPERIKTFRVQVDETEDPLKALEKSVVPKQEKLPSNPLNFLEKIKLGFYRLLFRPANSGTKTTGSADETKKPSWLGKLILGLSSKSGPMLEKMQRDLENLEERNQKQIDKLLKLLKDNPEEALKYAIPIDNSGAARGKEGGFLDLNVRWNNLSLFQSPNSGNGRVVDIGDYGTHLTNQYLKTAQELVDKGEYEKAAFVYMKLLKNNYKAASTLEEGHYYKEAAALYLKHLKNTQKAAECYEKGNMTDEAVKLYVELKKYEKAGDLYLKLSKKELAYQFYEQSVAEEKSKKKYLNASSIYRQKMNNPQKSQDTLLEGWESGHEAESCLGNYFSAIGDSEEKKAAVNQVYAHKTNDKNLKKFLEVIEKEHRKQNELKPFLREFSYEVIAEKASRNPDLTDLLKRLNSEDKEIAKDTSRFRLKKSRS